jgi:hypothetical protein
MAGGNRGEDVKIAYLPGRAKLPQPSLAGALLRHRPITAIRISGPGGSWILDGLLDSGSDDTIFPAWVAPMIGVDLAIAIDHDIHLAGRGKPIRCRYASAKLTLTDGAFETYEWDAMIGFVAVPMKCPLLGQAGFLQFFDITLQGADHLAILSPNWSFTGKRL